MTGDVTTARRGQDLPQVRAEVKAWEAAAKALDDVREHYDFAVVASLGSHPSDLDRRRARIALDALQTATRQLEGLRPFLDDFSRPATKREIAIAMNALAGPFSMSSVSDPAIYGRMLVEKVGEQEPAAGPLDRACDRLVATQKFLPSIAEVLEEVERQSAELRAWSRMVERLPAVIGDLTARLGAADTYRAEIAARTEGSQAAT